jgi:transposase-like protein
LTALWEQELTRIEAKELSQESFIAEVGAMVGEIVKEPLNLTKIEEISGLPKKKQCLTEDCDGFLIRKTGTYGPFYACPVCKHIFRERDGEPVRSTNASSEAVEADCPLGCGKKARRFNGKYGPFWKCFCSPNVKFKDVDGKPAVPEERTSLVSAKCPVKKCKGTVARYNAKSDGRPFWKCETCKNFFDDADGKPIVRESREVKEMTKMIKMAILQQLKRNARNNLKKTSLRVVIGVEAALWAFILLAWIIKSMR